MSNRENELEEGLQAEQRGYSILQYRGMGKSVLQESELVKPGKMLENIEACVVPITNPKAKVGYMKSRGPLYGLLSGLSKVKDSNTYFNLGNFKNIDHLNNYVKFVLCSNGTQSKEKDPQNKYAFILTNFVLEEVYDLEDIKVIRELCKPFLVEGTEPSEEMISIMECDYFVSFVHYLLSRVSKFHLSSEYRALAFVLIEWWNSTRSESFYSYSNIYEQEAILYVQEYLGKKKSNLDAIDVVSKVSRRLEFYDMDDDDDDDDFDEDLLYSLVKLVPQVPTYADVPWSSKYAVTYSVLSCNAKPLSDLSKFREEGREDCDMYSDTCAESINLFVKSLAQHLKEENYAFLQGGSRDQSFTLDMFFAECFNCLEGDELLTTRSVIMSIFKTLTKAFLETDRFDIETALREPVEFEKYCELLRRMYGMLGVYSDAGVSTFELNAFAVTILWGNLLGAKEYTLENVTGYSEIFKSVLYPTGVMPEELAKVFYLMGVGVARAGRGNQTISISADSNLFFEQAISKYVSCYNSEIYPALYLFDFEDRHEVCFKAEGGRFVSIVWPLFRNLILHNASRSDDSDNCCLKRLYMPMLLQSETATIPSLLELTFCVDFMCGNTGRLSEYKTKEREDCNSSLAGKLLRHATDLSNGLTCFDLLINGIYAQVGQERLKSVSDSVIQNIYHDFLDPTPENFARLALNRKYVLNNYGISILASESTLETTNAGVLDFYFRNDFLVFCETIKAQLKVNRAEVLRAIFVPKNGVCVYQYIIAKKGRTNKDKYVSKFLSRLYLENDSETLFLESICSCSTSAIRKLETREAQLSEGVY